MSYIFRLLLTNLYTHMDIEIGVIYPYDQRHLSFPLLKTEIEKVDLTGYFG